MVATLLKIRFRILGNTLSRHPWQLVGFILGSAWAALMLGLITLALLFVGNAGLETARYVIIAGGAVLTLGWVVAPIFAAGLDTTLDPSRLATFPITIGRMMVAITAATLTGVPGIATALGGMASIVAWWRWPLALLAAIVCVPLGVLLCVVASRTLAAITGGLSGGRRIRETVGILAFVVVVFAGPLVIGAQSLIASATDQTTTRPHWRALWKPCRGRHSPRRGRHRGILPQGRRWSRAPRS